MRRAFYLALTAAAFVALWYALSANKGWWPVADGPPWPSQPTLKRAGAIL